MNKVNQTKFGKGGNCFCACLAIILGIDIESVPEFDENNWIKELNEWLGRVFGLYYIQIDIEKGNPFKPRGYHTIGGVSPRAKGFPQVHHAVVGKNGRMVFDPHPSRDGLKQRRNYGLLVPIDPAKMRIQ